MDLIKELRARRAAAIERAQELAAFEAGDNARALSDEEAAEYDAKLAEARALKARIAELEELAADQAEQRKAVQDAGVVEADKVERKVGGAKVTDAPVYSPANQTFFRDAWMRVKGIAGSDVNERLHRNFLQVQEKRSSDGITTGLGDGGELVPPLWLEEDYVPFLRAGRVFADRQQKNALPAGTNSINLPKITGGTAVAAQATQNSEVNILDVTTSSVSSSVVTLAGGKIVSQQLLEQSPINVDAMIMQDLGLDYAKKLDSAVISGAGTSGTLKGLTSQSNVISATFTGSTVAAFYSALAGAIAQVQAVRFLPPTSITMHPRRWSWIEAASDSTGRPLVVPTAQGRFNNPADGGDSVAEGFAGNLLGIPVYLDPNISTTLNTNQDQVLIGRMEDNWLYEATPRVGSFEQTYAENLSLLVRLYNYVAYVSRYPEAVVVLGGSGLATPTF